MKLYALANTAIAALVVAACSSNGASRASGSAPDGGTAGGSVSSGGGSGKGPGNDAAGSPGDDAGAGDAGVPAPSGVEGGSSPPDASVATIGHPSASVVADAVAAALSSYHRNTSTGDIWCTPCDGAPVMLAAASYAGDTSADARLLQQMRLLLGGSNDPFGTGGYSANDERNATAMYAIAKRTPRIWSQLTVDRGPQDRPHHGGHARRRRVRDGRQDERQRPARRPSTGAPTRTATGTRTTARA